MATRAIKNEFHPGLTKEQHSKLEASFQARCQHANRVAELWKSNVKSSNEATETLQQLPHVKNVAKQSAKPSDYQNEKDQTSKSTKRKGLRLRDCQSDDERERGMTR